ncbi:MAG: DUF3169 family protein [Lachnospiraceae bacterium]|nr:DUF3169 family protein [Lachnospiraceae bacterium]
MTNRKNEIRKENRRSIPLFLVLIVIGGIVGGLIGFFGTYFEDSLNIGIQYLVDYLPMIIFGIMLLFAFGTQALGWPIYMHCRKKLELWDGEEDATPRQINLSIGYLMWGITVNIIIAFLSFSVSITYGFMNYFVAGIFTVAVIIFILDLFLTIFLQQKLVDLLKEMNPEKKGSIYDVKFQSKWLESCDEAEKLQIYQSSWASYRVMSHVYIFAWMITFLANLFFDVGIFSTVIISVLWLIHSSVYCYKSIQLDSSSIM